MDPLFTYMTERSLASVSVNPSVALRSLESPRRPVLTAEVPLDETTTMTTGCAISESSASLVFSLLISVASVVVDSRMKTAWGPGAEVVVGGDAVEVVVVVAAVVLGAIVVEAVGLTVVDVFGLTVVVVVVVVVVLGATVVVFGANVVVLDDTVVGITVVVGASVEVVVVVVDVDVVVVVVVEDDDSGTVLGSWVLVLTVGTPVALGVVVVVPFRACVVEGIAVVVDIPGAEVVVVVVGAVDVGPAVVVVVGPMVVVGGAAVVGANVIGSISRHPRMYIAKVVLKRLFSGAPSSKFGRCGDPDSGVAYRALQE
jgi:hypothetical protein